MDLLAKSNDFQITSTTIFSLRFCFLEQIDLVCRCCGQVRNCTCNSCGVTDYCANIRCFSGWKWSAIKVSPTKVNWNSQKQHEAPEQQQKTWFQPQNQELQHLYYHESYIHHAPLSMVFSSSVPKRAASENLQNTQTSTAQTAQWHPFPCTAPRQWCQ